MSNHGTDEHDAHDDIPELEDVVAPPPAAEPAPPPNLDLFEAPGIDAAVLREALARRLHEEVDATIGAVRAGIEEMLRAEVEERLRERLPDILEAALAEAASPESRDS